MHFFTELKKYLSNSLLIKMHIWITILIEQIDRYAFIYIVAQTGLFPYFIGSLSTNNAKNHKLKDL